jgi:hypothetical protein
MFASDRGDRLASIGALGDDGEVGMIGEERAKPQSRERLVVHDDGADHGAG